MNIFRWLRLKTSKTLVNIYGPPTLDEDHDPIVAADREFAEEVRAEEEADAQEAEDTLEAERD